MERGEGGGVDGFWVIDSHFVIIIPTPWSHGPVEVGGWFFLLKKGPILPGSVNYSMVSGGEIYIFFYPAYAKIESWFTVLGSFFFPLGFCVPTAITKK